MNYQVFTDCVEMPCCVMSVEKTAQDTPGEIRIVCSNQAYKEVMGPAYYDGMLYYELVPKDNKFENYCYQAAILKRRMHAYVETRALNCWTDQTLIPLASDREELGYCQFIFEFTKAADADRMAGVSVDTAQEVIKASIKLIGTEDLKTSINDVVKDIMDACEAKGARIMLVNHKKKEAVIFCDCLADDSTKKKDELEDVITYDLISTWESALGDSNAVIIKDEQDMAAFEEINRVWVESMREAGVRSLVLIPLRRKTVIGYLYVINFNVDKLVEVKELTELMAFFLGSEIDNYLLLHKLEELSQIDVLTGINNRRAMIQRVKELSMDQEIHPYGVVNIDLNGLKVVNDRDGHSAGDRLLIQAGEILKKVFYQEDLFRTGGDEFIVITNEIKREKFEQKVNRLHRDVEKNSEVSFAIGAYWSDGTTDLTTAFRYADEIMYADKKAYYEKHPEFRRS